MGEKELNELKFRMNRQKIQYGSKSFRLEGVQWFSEQLKKGYSDSEKILSIIENHLAFEDDEEIREMIEQLLFAKNAVVELPLAA